MSGVCVCVVCVECVVCVVCVVCSPHTFSGRGAAAEGALRRRGDQPKILKDFRGCVQDFGRTPPLCRTPLPKNFALFFSSPATIFILSSLSWGVLSLNYGRDPEMCTFGLS